MFANRLQFVVKVIIAHIYVFLLSVCFLSCGDAGVKRSIAVADSLADADQAVAVRYIDSICRVEPGLSRGDRMKLLLLRMKALNKADCPLDSEMLVRLVGYFDGHGTANDKMLANYILGCYYMSCGDSPAAMRCLHIAAEVGDTTSRDCDLHTLHKVHVHAALLLMRQNALTDAMAENALALKYALQAKDTFNAIITLEQRANIYLNQGQGDKALSIRSKLYGMYMRYGYAKEAAISQWPLASILARCGNIAGAKCCIDIFEKASGLIDSTGNIEQGRESYYIDKGIYHTKANMLDSAEFYFRKCLVATSSSFDLKDGYVGLSEVYKRRHNPDSVAKYAELARIATDSMYASMNTTHLQQMRAMYDYNEYKLSAEVYKREAVSARLTSIIVIIVAAMVSVGVGGYIRKKRRVRRMEILRYERSISALEQARQELCAVNEQQQTEMARLIDEKTNEIERQRETNENYRRDIQELERVKDELYSLSERQRMQFNSLIAEKDVQIAQLYQEKQKYEQSVNMARNVKAYSNEPVVKLLKRRARKDLTLMTNDEVNSLKCVFTDVEQFNKIEGLVNANEYLVCMLVKVGFTPSDICVLTGLSNSNISNIRKRLLMKLTGRNGSPKDFDAYIINL